MPHPSILGRPELLQSTFLALLIGAIAVALPTLAQEPAAPTSEAFAGLQLRNIGPALMSGRIADIAIHPRRRNTWYVAVGSGGVWKTTNAGTTWTPLFDQQGSYSIGALAIDPSNPEVIWVGSGENVSGRHVGYGDGVYKSSDGGATWSNLGLENSEHISKIVIDPRDSRVVWVAAEGPLWSAGGERGVFKTTDGGATWSPSLSISADTGVADLEADPRNPDALYAAAYQRRRTVWSLLAGGPESGIWKSTDGGKNWRKLVTGLPKGEMGKIGLAVSPQDPDVLYATIEASEEEQGFYRSANGGESWEKRNGYLSDGTGPHYYQEIFASPHRFDRVYQMDVFVQYTDDGGKTFRPLGETDKHSDNHALAFDPDDPEHLLLGCDGGFYETFDHGTSWKFMPNLPVTQIYKLAVDDDTPFYNVIGGTQDNGTQAGPSRTKNVHGIRNQDWYVAYGADGYATAIEPGNPDVVYVSWQTGHPLRYDRKTGELVDIQPQPAPGDPPERFNWDAPILVSPHSPARVYYGSYRLWRSDDRGQSWRALSGDLSRGGERYLLPVGGRVRSADALWGNTAMSWYATLTAVAESPLQEGLLYTGSDDGVIAVTEDGGTSWRKTERIGGIPELAFVNELKASLHDRDTVFAALDNHKQGDYRPYLIRSDDRGRTWKSIAGDLPERLLVWSVAQDHVDRNLLFVGAETGLFFTRDGGQRWIKLTGGVPTIAVRDLEIQRRENDLVAASFGRGFFILDDYSPLRTASAETLAREATLFPVRDALWYVPELRLADGGKGSSGSDEYAAPNPPFGAVFTVYLKSKLETAKELRAGREKPSIEAAKDVPFPGFDALREESLEDAPRLVLTVTDASGEVVRRVEVANTAGFQRVAWDLRYPPPDPIALEPPADLPPWVEPPRGPLAAPGRYSVRLGRVTGGRYQAIGEAQSFAVVPLEGATAPGSPYDETLTFSRRTADLQRKLLGAVAESSRAADRLAHLERAAQEAGTGGEAALAQVSGLRRELADLDLRLTGDPIRQRLQEPTAPSPVERVQTVIEGHWGSRQGPTQTHRDSITIAAAEYAEISAELRRLIEVDIPALEDTLERAGAPWTPGRRLPP